MKNIFTVIVLSVFMFCPAGASEKARVIQTEDVRSKESYPWITFMSQGPIKWSLDGNQQSYGVAFRAIITTSEIYSGIIIEKIHLGEEGCCKKIEYAIGLNVDDIAKEFNITQEFANAQFVAWEAFNRFAFTQKSRVYQVAIENDRSVKITEKKQAGKAL